jgi:cytoskeleton protein RodZ
MLCSDQGLLEDTMDTGAQLRSAREALGLSLASLAQKTRVQPRIISAIEDNDLPSIPPKPFGRGFVRAYAREVGLDPEQTVRDYFAQFPPTPVEVSHVSDAAAEPWPARTSWFGAAALIAIALVSLAVLRGGAGDDVASEPPAPVGTVGTTTERAPEAPNANGTIGRSADAAPARKGLAIVLNADRACWVTATADGSRVLYQLLPPGGQYSIDATREITIRSGDAGALRVTVNGRQTGALGTDGQVRTVRITPETAPAFGVRTGQ